MRDNVSIVVPMAGEGSRFKDAGYTAPKPFIRIEGRPMVALVLDNLYYPDAEYLLVARREHADADPTAMSELLDAGNVRAQFLDTLTEGTACTVLEACKLLDPDSHLLVANSDQLVRNGVQAMLDDALTKHLDGSIMVFRDEGDPKWSFARLDDRGRVVEVAEKKPISDLATVGIYYFRTVRQFVDAAQAMIAADDRINGEFYTCPVYNYLIRQGGNVGVFEIDARWMSGLGTPADLEHFLENDLNDFLHQSS